MAKATIERDLKAARAKRLAREQEAIAERDRIAAEASAKHPELLQGEDEGKNSRTLEQGKDVTEMVMTNEIPVANPESENNMPTAMEEPSTSKVEEIGSPTQKNEPAPPPALDMSSLSNRDIKEENESSNVPPTSAGEGVDTVAVSEAVPEDETPATAGLKDMNFESMFADLDGGGSKMNYDLDFSVDGADHMVLGDDPFINNIVENQSSLIPENSGEDISSLLPGLENYANDGGDEFGMLDNQTTSGPENSLDMHEQTTQQLPPTTNAPTDVLPSESNFDDLFDSGGLVMDGENDETGDGTLGGGNEFLDDAFFIMDGT